LQASTRCSCGFAFIDNRHLEAQPCAIPPQDDFCEAGWLMTPLTREENCGSRCLAV
jgi:hypothetical protein